MSVVISFVGGLGAVVVGLVVVVAVRAIVGCAVLFVVLFLGFVVVFRKVFVAVLYTEMLLLLWFLIDIDVWCPGFVWYSSSFVVFLSLNGIFCVGGLVLVIPPVLEVNKLGTV